MSTKLDLLQERLSWSDAALSKATRTQILVTTIDLMEIETLTLVIITQSLKIKTTILDPTIILMDSTTKTSAQLTD